jgi:hypothetical protein
MKRAERVAAVGKTQACFARRSGCRAPQQEDSLDLGAVTLVKAFSLSRGNGQMAKFKIYDDNDNFIGEYVGELVDEAKDKVSGTSEGGIGLGWLICLIIGGFVLYYLYVALKFICRILWISIKFIAKWLWAFVKWLLPMLWFLFIVLCVSLWWLVRLPFTWFIRKEIPEWWMP